VRMLGEHPEHGDARRGDPQTRVVKLPGDVGGGLHGAALDHEDLINSSYWVDRLDPVRFRPLGGGRPGAVARTLASTA
jgi:hypothetical protein